MPRIIVLFALLLVVPSSALSQVLPDGAAVFQKACASCHLEPPPDSRAGTREALGRLAPEAILTALTVGNMFRQGAELTDAERRAVAEFLSGRAPGAAAPPVTAGRCPAAPAALDSAALDEGWNGWGGDVTNTRYRPLEKGGVAAAMVPRLTLKWAFGFDGVSSARAQPAVAGGRLFVGSESGTVYALDAKTGCTHWTFQARHSIRTAMSLGAYRRDTREGIAVYFADGGAVAYAVDSMTGEELWSNEVDSHPYAASTGSPTVHGGRVYVTTAGVGEEGQGGRAQYECCTFRGSVSALDASTGRLLWKSFSIAEPPAPRAKNKNGVQTWGPAGGGIWSAPTIDARRRLVYVTTGNGYAGPPQPTTDAVLALDMETGALRWSFQPTAEDVWTGGCPRTGNPEENPNCPARLGPDHDFSMSPVLVRRPSGQDLLIVHQKSGMAYALDPEKQGALVWEYRASPGAGLGGQWGAAVDDRQAYFGVAASGGLRAVNLDTGREVWSQPPPERLCGTGRGCSASQGAALTVVPGMVFSVSMDGGVRAYAADDGSMAWQFDTNREFETVNGVKARGGAMDGPGVVVEDGMMYLSSGYVSLIGRPGNVLLAFAID